MIEPLHPGCFEERDPGRTTADGSDKLSFYHRQDAVFAADHVLLWSNLSRLNGLLIILNISMFFMTGLINRGYYYTFYSVAGLSVVGLGMVVPTILIRRLWYYLCFIFVEVLAMYFFVASIVYWVRHGA